MENNQLNITVCPYTLQEGHNTYSPQAIKELFGGMRISHVLPFASPAIEGAEQLTFIEKRKRISISGVQEKYSLKLIDGKLELVEKGGEYILKPIPSDILYPSQVPANEHLTMQIAAQVFKIPVAKSAIIFFESGEPAYITKRFDLKPNGQHCQKEDFASIAQQSIQNAEADYKYNYSYLKMANLIDQYFPAAIPTKERFFELLLFNYLLSNGDAHLKNFSRMDCDGNGDGLLAPAYDLLNTKIHTNDGDMALHDGLYDDDYKHPSFATLGYYGYDDFETFGLKMGLVPIRINRMIDRFLNKTAAIENLVLKSFMNAETKAKYMQQYYDKLKRLSFSVKAH